ncbi:MAG: ATP-binding cassette domain-containing protein [Pseudomonadota bacterium]
MITLRDIHVAFTVGDGARMTALAGIDLTIGEGEFVTLIGTNGAGKSTLLNVLAGTVEPTRGQLAVDGVDVTRTRDFERAAWLSRVFPDPRLGTCDQLTIEENLALALTKGRRRGMGRPVSSADRAMLVRRLADLGLGLETRLSTPARLLSSGQRQSLTVLMATLSQPRLLLLDEHVANLDPRTQANILAVTDTTIRREALAAIMVTHDVRHALDFGDRLIALKGGRIVLDVCGDAKSSLTMPDIDAVYGEERMVAVA